MSTKRKNLTGAILVRVILTLTLSLTLLVGPVYSAIPQTINYQGYLTNAAGLPMFRAATILRSVEDIVILPVALMLRSAGVPTEIQLGQTTGVREDYSRIFDRKIWTSPIVPLGHSIGFGQSSSDWSIRIDMVPDGRCSQPFNELSC